MAFMRYGSVSFIILLSHFFLIPAFAASPPIGVDQQIHQQQQQKAREQKLAPIAKDVRMREGETEAPVLEFPTETPCFLLQYVELDIDKKIPRWLPLKRIASHAVGHCLGKQGIGQLIKNLQNNLISHGYITSEVSLPSQNIGNGHLKLKVIAGTVGKITFLSNKPQYAHIYNTFPLSENDILDLRGIEQGLENILRIPQAQASIKLIPGENFGQTDVLVDRQQTRYWRLGAYVDDSGSRYTGRYQTGMTLFLDNPLSLSDMLYVSAGRALRPGNTRGSKNLIAGYSVPFGYWEFNALYSQNSYHQNISGNVVDYQYSGKDHYLKFGVTRVIYRSGTQKTSLSYDVILRRIHRFINDTELQNQQQKTSSWRVGLNHKHYFGDTTVNAGLFYKQGTRWFGAKPAPTEASGNGTALSKIFQANLSTSIPFNIGNQSFSYAPEFLGQVTRDRLIIQDQFTLGSRWSVRGFDGEYSLMGNRGWYWRNDLNWNVPKFGQQVYLAMDYGEISGQTGYGMSGKRLAGGGVGLRGYKYGIGYDFFAGLPIAKPDRFITDPFTLGFSLNWQY